MNKACCNSGVLLRSTTHLHSEKKPEILHSVLLILLESIPIQHWSNMLNI